MFCISWENCRLWAHTNIISAGASASGPAALVTRSPRKRAGEKKPRWFFSRTRSRMWGEHRNRIHQKEIAYEDGHLISASRKKPITMQWAVSLIHFVGTDKLPAVREGATLNKSNLTTPSARTSSTTFTLSALSLLSAAQDELTTQLTQETPEKTPAAAKEGMAF